MRFIIFVDPSLLKKYNCWFTIVWFNKGGERFYFPRTECCRKNAAFARIFSILPPLAAICRQRIGFSGLEKTRQASEEARFNPFNKTFQGMQFNVLQFLANCWYALPMSFILEKNSLSSEKQVLRLWKTVQLNDRLTDQPTDRRRSDGIIGKL